MTSANWSYLLRTRIVFGSGSLNSLSERLKEFSFSKALIVTSKGAMRKTGILQRVIDQVGGKKAVVFEEVEPNPDIGTVLKGAERAEEEKCDLVIGLGGGSSLDAAKAISILITNDIGIREFFEKDDIAENEALNLVMIPTTSGTASEINKFAVVSDEHGRKNVIREDKAIPRIAIVDPELTLSCPKKLTATTGLDALCHAIESYWSKNTNPLSRIFALKAIELVNANLEEAFSKGENLEAREGMSLASLYAGLAFSNTGTTDLHKAGYPLTERFRLEHGFACAMALPPYLEFNEKGNKETLSEIAGALGKKNAKEAAQRVRQIMGNVKAPQKLSEIGVRKKDIEMIVEEGYSNNKRNNPRDMTKEEFREMITKLF